MTQLDDMEELSLNDVTIAQRTAMGLRMEIAVVPARIEKLGKTMLSAAKRAGGILFSGDPYGIAALADTGAVFLYSEPQDPDEEPPIEEAG
ncbi:MAG: hypothetical protein ACHQT5_00645 [Candidatus Saccharimonadales bacterium]|jgi:hypothetical protein